MNDTINFSKLISELLILFFTYSFFIFVPYLGWKVINKFISFCKTKRCDYKFSAIGSYDSMTKEFESKQNIIDKEIFDLKLKMSRYEAISDTLKVVISGFIFPIVAGVYVIIVDKVTENNSYIMNIFGFLMVLIVWLIISYSISYFYNTIVINLKVRIDFYENKKNCYQIENK